MNRYHIHDTELTNFLSVVHTLKVTFDQHATTLITGHNGSGKSTFLDGTVWVLYGSPYRVVDKISDLACVFSDGPTIGKVNLSAHGHQWTIVRGLNPTILEVYRDGLRVWEGEKHKKDIGKRIELEIMCMSKKTFITLTMQGTANKAFNSFPTMTKGDRRILIEDILGISILSGMQEEAKLIKRSLEKKKQEADRNCSVAEAELKQAVAHNKQLDGDINLLVQEKRDKITAKRSEIARLSKAITTDKLEAEALKKKISEFPAIDTIIETTKGEIRDAKKKSEDAKKALAFYEAHEDCPTCHQSITADFKRNVKKAHQAEVDEANAELTKLVDRLQDEKKIQEEKLKLSRDMQQLLSDIRIFQTDIARIELEIVDLEAEIELFTNGKRIEKPDIERLQQARDEQNQIRDRIVRSIYEMEIMIDLCSEDKVRKKILENHLAFINRTANEYARALGFTGQIELDNQCQLTLYMNGYERSYGICSSGERWRVDTAFLFTWRALARQRYSASVNILWQDETIDSSLDAQGVEDYMNFKRHYLKNDNVLIVSHSPVLMTQIFDRHLAFDKWRNNTRMTEVV